MFWHVREIYVCRDPVCLSEVLVIQEPRTDLRGSGPPTCTCGKAMEKKPLGVGEPEVVRVAPGEEIKRDASEEPE